MTADTTLRLAKDFKNIIAIKEASANLDQMGRILKHKPKDFMLISGDDALTLPIIAMGGEGVISVVGNALPNEFGNLVHAAIGGRSDNGAKGALAPHRGHRPALRRRQSGRHQVRAEGARHLR
jgi:4-hydroxy-tetrahydrodipicolinate synthase